MSQFTAGPVHHALILEKSICHRDTETQSFIDSIECNEVKKLRLFNDGLNRVFSVISSVSLWLCG